MALLQEVYCGFQPGQKLDAAHLNENNQKLMQAGFLVTTTSVSPPHYPKG